MKGLEQQWKAVQKQLDELGKQAQKARGQARRRMKRLERRTRVAVARALRRAEPQVRLAVSEAARVGRGLRAGVKAGTAAYRAGARRRKS
jgi:response regulator of citrate/malate metabolism